MRYGQIVMGPAGCGKSTYCSNVVKHCQTVKRTIHVVNLDPAAEHFDYPVDADVRDLISVDDVMEDEYLKLGPNGGLIFCMEHLIKNVSWMEEKLEDYNDDDYVLFDCPAWHSTHPPCHKLEANCTSPAYRIPRDTGMGTNSVGQIELYTHVPVMRQLVDRLQNWNFRLCGVFLLDSQFLIDTAKFFAGSMAALSAMITLELPHVNVLSKMDLLDKKAKKEVEKYLDPDPPDLLAEVGKSMNKKYHKLNKAITTLLNDFSLVRFFPLDISDEDSIGELLLYIDNTIQYGEDLDVKVPREYDDFDDT